MKANKKGALFMLVAACFFALTAALVKSLPDIPVAEKVFFRNIIGLMPVLIVNIKKRKMSWGSNKPFLILRAILGLIATGAYYFALSRAPLADTVILMNVYPFFIVIFSFYFLKEDIKKEQLYALVLSITGAILVIRPQFNAINFVYIITLFAAILTAGAYTTVKHLKKTEDSVVIMFYFSLVTAIGFLPFMLKSHFVVPVGMNLIKLLVLGASATCYQMFMTTAYKFAPAGEIAVYSYASIVISSIIGVIFWSEVPSLLSLLGAGLIIIAAFINYRKDKES